MSTRRTSSTPSWLAPLVCVLIGAVLAAVHLVADDAGDALRSFGLMAVLAVLLVVGGRMETIRALRGDGRDERWAAIDTRATAVLGGVLTLAVVVLTLYEWAAGRNGSPYVQLMAIGAGAYVLALVWINRRSR
jgi:hypothetical protein